MRPTFFYMFLAVLFSRVKAFYLQGNGTIIAGQVRHWAALSQAIQCGIQSEKHQPGVSFGRKLTRIIGGGYAEKHSWPWQVLLTIGDSMCGASLVPVKDNTEISDILVTAAHCVTKTTIDQEGYNKAQKLIKAGKVTSMDEIKRLMRYVTKEVGRDTITASLGVHVTGTIATGQKERHIAKIIVRDDFKMDPQSGDVRNDLALLKLAMPIKFSDTIRPICLPAQDEELPVEKPCVATGWGHTTTNAQFPSNLLKELVMPVHSGITCTRNEFGGWGAQYDEATKLCAGPLEGGSSTCHGDSGGPLACKIAYIYTLYGATSYGDGKECLYPGKPKMFTRVSNFVDWIKDETKKVTTVKRLFNFNDVFGTHK